MGDMTRAKFECQIVVPIVTGLRLNKMKSKAVWISCILAALFCARPANASVIMTLDQVGPNVVATASGTIDLTDLQFEGNLVGSILPIVGPTAASLRVVAFSGEVPLASLSEYTGVSGPASFGPGPGRIATLSVGDVLGILSGSIIEVLLAMFPTRRYSARLPGTTPAFLASA